jgi:SAM-dependent methyltransferase
MRRRAPDARPTIDEAGEAGGWGKAPELVDDGFCVTDDGIWVPTPLAVVDAMLGALGGLGWWADGEPGAPRRCLDAGMGDGRLVAALCRLGPHVQAAGIESDRALYQRALDNLGARAASGWRAARGSYLELKTYDALGLATTAIDVVFNYPDGNERALVQFWRARGRPGSRLVFCCPDHSLTLPGLALECVLPTVRGFRLHVGRV